MTRVERSVCTASGVRSAALVAFLLMTYAFLPQEALGQWTTNANDINNTTCNVGVGTATPVEKLTINGDQHQPRILARPGLDVQNPVSRPQSTGSPPAGADRRD